MDRHFSPQYVNVLSDYVAPDFVGHLEDMASVDEYLGGQRVPITAHSLHQTGASQRMCEFYGKDEVSPIDQYYCLDFEIFGCSQDPPSLFPIYEYAIHKIDRSVLREYFRSRTTIDANTTVNSRKYEST